MYPGQMPGAAPVGGAPMYPGQMPGAMPGAPMPGAVAAPMPGAPMPGAMAAPMPGAMAAPMPGAMAAPMPGAMAAPMPGAVAAPMPGAPMPGAPMPGMMPGAPMPGAPMPGAPMPGMMPGAPAGGFPPGYPVFTGQLGPNMYYKPIWTAKRDAKLQKVWYKIARDGRITYKEIQKLLDEFHYKISMQEAMWFYNTLDVNRDGRIDLPEVRIAMQQFIMTYPRMRNMKKKGIMKPHYQMGYNWRSNPCFPAQYGHLWRF